MDIGVESAIGRSAQVQNDNQQDMMGYNLQGKLYPFNMLTEGVARFRSDVEVRENGCHKDLIPRTTLG